MTQVGILLIITVTTRSPREMLLKSDGICSAKMPHNQIPSSVQPVVDLRGGPLGPPQTLIYIRKNIYYNLYNAHYTQGLYPVGIRIQYIYST